MSKQEKNNEQPQSRSDYLTEKVDQIGNELNPIDLAIKRLKEPQQEENVLLYAEGPKRRLMELSRALSDRMNEMRESNPEHPGLTKACDVHFKIQAYQAQLERLGIPSYPYAAEQAILGLESLIADSSDNTAQSALAELNTIITEQQQTPPQDIKKFRGEIKKIIQSLPRWSPEQRGARKMWETLVKSLPKASNKTPASAVAGTVAMGAAKQEGAAQQGSDAQVTPTK